MKLVITITLMAGLVSCGLGSKTEANLSAGDLEYINTIIPLEKGEEIQLFETNGGAKGVKAAGNFITDKRLASYWIDGDDRKVKSMQYTEIDSIQTVPKLGSLTMASFLKVYSADKTMKVYVSADSARTWTFFNKAIKNWETAIQR